MVAAGVEDRWNQLPFLWRRSALRTSPVMPAQLALDLVQRLARGRISDEEITLTSTKGGAKKLTELMQIGFVTDRVIS